MRKRADRAKHDGLPHLLDQCNIEQMERCLLQLKRGEEAGSSSSGQMFCVHWSHQLLMMLLHHMLLTGRPVQHYCIHIVLSLQACHTLVADTRDSHFLC